MPYRKEILEWYRGKATRGREIAELMEYGRSPGINNLHAQKQEIKRYIKTMVLEKTMRDSAFGMFNDISRDRQIDKALIAKGHDPMVDLKKRTRNRLQTVRIIRFNSGLPPVFNDFKTPFWTDPHSGFIPEDHLKDAIKAGVEFHTAVFLVGHATAGQVARDIWGRTRHGGRWTVWLPDEDEIEDSKAKQPYRFMFENLTDMVEFRLTFDFRQPEAA
jgi:hypothetical protein